MINVSDIIHDPDFERDIVIERTSGGHFEKSKYVVPTKTIITLKGVLVNPKNSREIIQTEQGDIVTGYVKIFVDESTPIYVTRDDSTDTGTENNISDVVIEGYGTSLETRYRITNTFNRSQWGVIEAEALKVGASG